MIPHLDIVTFNFPMSRGHAIANELIIALSIFDRNFLSEIVFLFSWPDREIL